MKYVKKVWNIEPQKMLDTIIKMDREQGYSAPDYGASFYIGKPLEYIREVYEQYTGIDSLSDNDLIEKGYYRLEIS